MERGKNLHEQKIEPMTIVALAAVSLLVVLFAYRIYADDFAAWMAQWKHFRFAFGIFAIGALCFVGCWLFAKEADSVADTAQWVSTAKVIASITITGTALAALFGVLTQWLEKINNIFP